MEQVSKSLKGTVLAAFASAILWGHAAAVPTPIYPLSTNPGSEAYVTGAPTPSHAVAAAPGARILSRSGKLTASARFHGGSSIMGGAARSSRWKSRYIMSGLVLATMTPLALHRPGEPGDKSIAAQTQAPATSSLPALGGRGSEGGDRGGNDDKGQNEGRGGNGGNGGNRGDDGDDDDGDDDGDHDDGDEVCEDDGDHDGGNGGHNGGGNGGGDNGGEDDTPGNGDHDGGGIPLPEPGTVPVLGAGLIMALALRSRRNH